VQQQQQQKGRGPKQDAEPDGKGRKRKRTKTRSKQKNIRKDKRTQDQRPAHLRVGSDGFSGRALTEETRKRMGIGAASP
jgi:hypothetical protein